MTNLVFVDTETTGLKPDVHSIWEIGYAVNHGPVKASKVWHSAHCADAEALRIGNYYSRNAASLTIQNYNDSERALIGNRYVFGNRQTLAWEQEFYNELNGNVLVAANPHFDAQFLAKRYGHEFWHYRMIDIETYAMPVLDLDRPRGLAYIAEQLKVPAPDHSAYEDVRVLQTCFYKLYDYYINAQRPVLY